MAQGPEMAAQQSQSGPQCALIKTKKLHLSVESSNLLLILLLLCMEANKRIEIYF